MSKGNYVAGDAAYLSPAAQLGLFKLPRRRELLLQTAGEPPKDVLDVGCAGGYVSAMLMQSGHRVLGIELNAAMAAEARSLGVEVIEHDVEEGLPIPDSCMDVVHACEIIEHLFDTEGFLKDVRRVLRPHGALIVSTPNLNSLINRFSVLRGKPLRMWGAFPGDLHGSHIRVLNKAKMLQLLARTGFRADSIIGVNQSRASARLLDRLPTFSELILIRAVPTEGGHS